MRVFEWRPKGRSLAAILTWVRKSKLSTVRKRVFHALLIALIYHIWAARNDAFWQGKVWMITLTVKKVVKEIQLRLKFVMPKKANSRDRVWADAICTK